MVLYAAPIWASALSMAKNKKIVISAQRAALARMSTAYRTVSHGTLCMVTGSMPMHIKAKLRCKEYEAKRRYEEEGLAERHYWMEDKKRQQQDAKDRWRIEWAFHNPDNWTSRLINDPLIFVGRRRRINYYVMQILTGHGIFNKYRCRIGKENNSSCWDCGDDPDDAEHVLFKCPRWMEERASLEIDLGIEWSMEVDIVARMAEDDRSWQKFSEFCMRAMIIRHRKEKGLET